MTTQRILFDIELEPAIGSRFQPTGFPDLGHAEFVRPGGDRCLLVESEQSMANRFEAMLWDDGENVPIEVVAPLPYVKVVRDDESFVTSSRIEAHRLASAFIKDSTLDGESMMDVIKDRLALQKDELLDHRRIAQAVFALDPLALLHGVFFADGKWPGQPKIARAVTSFIEASGVERVESGGVKKDAVRHSIEGEAGGSSEGYGSVPFARTAWTAEHIVASYSLDLRQLRSYGLSDAATDLLRDLALLELRLLLDDGLRLRTACDLVATNQTITARDGTDLPSVDELSERVAAGVAASSDLFTDSVPLEVVWDGGKKKSK